MALGNKGGHDAAQFYTGLVAELYAPLRGLDPDPDIYEAFIRSSGEPALELGCGSGDPLVALLGRGLDVDGLDSSRDMVGLAAERLADAGLATGLHCESMEKMRLPRRYRSIFLAGPTFNLLPDDATALAALERIRDHLEPGGRALIPLFVPDPVTGDQLGLLREDVDASGRPIRCFTVSSERDEAERRQVTVLRYERDDGTEAAVIERPWELHWYSVAGFRSLVADAGLDVVSVRGWGGESVDDDATFFTFVVSAGT